MAQADFSGPASTASKPMSRARDSTVARASLSSAQTKVDAQPFSKRGLIITSAGTVLKARTTRAVGTNPATIWLEDRSSVGGLGALVGSTMIFPSRSPAAWSTSWTAP